MWNEFGFALRISTSQLHHDVCFNESFESHRDHSRLNGISIANNVYPNTPEAVSESQPLFVNGILLIYEGRVDNRKEIAHRLGRPKLSTAADGSVLVAAYEAWGPELSRHILGEYSFAILDFRNKIMIAGHDSIGVRRIWYCQRGDELWVTSNLDLLFKHFHEVRDSYDVETIPEYFAGMMTPISGKTIWRGIRELRPGRVLLLHGSSPIERVVWSPEEIQRQPFKTPERVDELFRQLLYESVGHALRSPGGVLCDLSGGYDSSTTAAVAASLVKASDTPPNLVSWGTVSKRSQNEAHFQDLVCELHGLKFHRVQIEHCLPFTVLEPAAIPFGGFLQTGAMYRAMRKFSIEQGLTCRMTGHGADVLLQKGTPPPIYLSDWLKQGRLLDWFEHLIGYLNTGAFSAWHLIGQCSFGTLEPLAAQFRRSPPTWLAGTFRKRIAEHHRDFLSACDRTFKSDARERLLRFTYAFIPMPRQLLPDERMPLLYRPLLEFLLSLDWKDVTAPGHTRLIMRRSLRGILPDEVRTGKADGQHGASLLEGLQQAWSKISDLTSGEHLEMLGVVDRHAFRAAVETLRSGFDGRQHQYLITALYLEIWLALQQQAAKSRGPQLFAA